MPNIFFIADTHFGEKDVFRMSRENYRFRTCEIKDRILTENWNRVVQPEDTVYILGDFGNPKYAERLNGKKILIKGNHDNYDEEDYLTYFKRTYDMTVLYSNFFLLSHEPLFIPDFHSPYVNLFGHVHNNPIYKTVSPRSYCVCACRINYTPILYKTILEEITKEDKQYEFC